MTVRRRHFTALILAAVAPLAVSLTLAVNSSRSTVIHQVGESWARMAQQVPRRFDRVRFERTPERRAAAVTGELVARAMGFADGADAVESATGAVGAMQGDLEWTVLGGVALGTVERPAADGTTTVSTRVLDEQARIIEGFAPVGSGAAAPLVDRAFTEQGARVLLAEPTASAFAFAFASASATALRHQLMLGYLRGLTSAQEHVARGELHVVVEPR